MIRFARWGLVGLLAFKLQSCNTVIDWEVVLSLMLGLGALGYAFNEHRRTSKLDDLAVTHAERITALEAVAVYATNVDKRLDGIDYSIARLEERGSPPDLLQLVDRVAATESVLGDVRERVAVVEARADHKPITQTRRKDGKFAPADAVADEVTR